LRIGSNRCHQFLLRWAHFSARSGRIAATSAETSQLVHGEQNLFSPLFQQLAVELRPFPANLVRVEDKYLMQFSDHGGHLPSMVPAER
jgi:hypothetical protein